MFDEEGNGLVKTEDLEKLMSLLGINPTKRELLTMAKDVDKDSKNLSPPSQMLCGSQEESPRQDRSLLDSYSKVSMLKYPSTSLFF